MEIIRNKEWIDGKSYRKRVLMDGLDNKVNLIQDVIVNPQSVIPSHTHESTDEIFYVTEGSAIMTINNQENKVSSGDMIYVSKHEEHGFRNESEQEFKMIVLKMNFQKGDAYLK